jgi:hypothetical protein
MLQQFELAWFVPYIERMARGESFTIDELQTIHNQHTGHRMEASLPSGQFGFMECPTGRNHDVSDVDRRGE